MAFVSNLYLKQKIFTEIYSGFTAIYIIYLHLY